MSRVCLLTLLLLALPARAEPHPSYAHVYSRLGALARSHPGEATVLDYGKSVRGRPLRAIRMQDPAAKPSGSRPVVLITGATHGDEYLDVEHRLPAHFLSTEASGARRFLAAGGLIYVVPVVNPDGFEARRRGNAKGVDLNRDFDLVPAKELKFKARESRALAALLEREIASRPAKLVLAVDYHCCDGSILYPWSFSDQAIPEAHLDAHEQVAKLMLQDIDASYRVGPTGPVLGYNARGTSKDYYYARYGALAFTFEGIRGEEAKKFQGHALFWDHVLAQLAGGAGT